MDIVVVRGAGDKDGGLIESALMTSIAVALEKGRIALDLASGLTEVVVVCKYRRFELGSIVEVSDNDLGEVWRGYIVGIVEKFSDEGAFSELRVLR